MSLPFPVANCPPLIRDAADDYKDLMTPGEYRAFVATLCSVIFGVIGYSKIARFAMFAPSVSSLADFFNAVGMAARINRRHARRLQRLLRLTVEAPSRFQWAVDDTLAEHSGQSIWGAYQWYDHSKKSHIYGHKVLILGIVDRKNNVLVPAFWEILHRDLSDQIEGASETGESHQKGWEIVLSLLDRASALGFPNLTIAADSWFAGEEFFDGLRERQLDYVVEIKSNRIVAHYGRSNPEIGVAIFFSERDRYSVSHNGKTKFASEATVTFRGSVHSCKAVAVANKRGLDDSAFAFYVTNRLTWNASHVWKCARFRWTIEVQFRELKQLFTFGEAAVRSKEAVETAISISVIALSVIRFEQIARALRNRNQYARPVPAGVIVRDLQLQSLLRSTSKLVAPHESKFREKFYSKIRKRNLDNKPTMTPCMKSSQDLTKGVKPLLQAERRVTKSSRPRAA